MLFWFDFGTLSESRGFTNTCFPVVWIYNPCFLLCSSETRTGDLHLNLHPQCFRATLLEVVSANAVKVDQARRRKPLGCRGEKTCLVHTKRKCLTKSGFKVQYECHWTQRLKRNIYRHVRSIQVAFATYSIVGFRHRRPRRTAPSCRRVAAKSSMVATWRRQAVRFCASHAPMAIPDFGSSFSWTGFALLG